MQQNPLLENKTLKRATDEFHDLLLSEKGLEARKYLASRAILEPEIHRFKIGYCNRGYFSNRVIFPIFDIEGEVVNITSRLILKEKTQRSHLHLPHVKQNWFYNEPILKNKIKKLILVESPIDCITLSRFEFNSVACIGANNANKGKIEKLAKVDAIYICFDNDLNESGSKASYRIAELIYRVFEKPARLIHIPFLIGPDVNSMCTKGIDGFKLKFNTLMQMAIPIVPKEIKKNRSLQRDYKIPKFDVIKLAEQYVELQPAGPGRYKAICPMHEETEPSFFVDQNTNRWICFGHGERGDAIDLLRAIERRRGNILTFQQAVRILEKI